MGTFDSQSRSLDDALRDLNNTLNKDEGIVNTSSAHRFRDQPADIDDEYQEYARTHLVQPDIDRFINELIDSLSDPDMEKSVPGYIVGPYGFGKTSTAGKVWYVLEDEYNYISTPPIYFDELQSIVDAVYGWMSYRLQDRPDYLGELDRVYEAKATNNIEDVVDQTDAEDKEEFRDDLQELVDSGKIDIDFSVTHVLEFLSECNQIAQEAGYAGLVVIADELQQFVSSHPSDKKAYSELRDLAKNIALGLNDGNGLGLLLTMDDGLHGDLDVNADDVLARLAEQNVKLNLSNVYARDFPTELWADLSRTFEFDERHHDIITEDALDAIGQICERGPPLSNGPRTVVDLFTIAIDHWLSEKNAFDALDLANAYYNGVVRFKGDHIKTAISEGTNADLINNPDRKDFIKLCGVFPRGISGDRLEQYGVHDAKEAVKSDLHGQIIITHEEGRTLKRLEREDEDRGIRDELFTQFYRDYDTTDVYNNNAASVFREHVLQEEIFPASRGKSLSSWVTEHEFEPETGGVYAAVFHGAFNGQQYPKRHIEIRVGSDADAVRTPAEGVNVDLSIGFVCDMEKDNDTTPHIEQVADDEALIYLDFTDAFGSLPNNIQMLDNYMSPEDVNPHLLLSLHNFMISWEEKRTINPNQSEQLDYIRNQLINKSIKKLFGPPLNTDKFISDGESSRRSVQATKVVEQAFTRMIAELYPDYTTLFISDNYVTFLEDYESLLIGNDPDIRISQKRGNTPIEGTKGDIADALGVSSNSTAKTRLEKQFETLIEKEMWSGSDARIRLKLHPLETILKDAIEDASDQTVRIEELATIAGKYGYREEEVNWALRLLAGREYIERDNDEGVVELSDIAIDYTEVEEKYESLQSRVADLNDIADSWNEYDEVVAQLDSISRDLDDASDEDIELLDKILADLQDIERTVDSQERATHATYLERCRGRRDNLKEFSSKTPPRDLNQSTDNVNIPFGMHLSDIKSELKVEFKDIQNRAEEAESMLQTQINSVESEASIDSIKALQRALTEAERTEGDINEDIANIESTAQDYADWCQLAVNMAGTRDEMVRYQNNHDDSTPVDPLVEELNQQLNEIQNAFQRDKDAILRNAGMHRSEFADIADLFQEITEGDEDDFRYRRFVLENTLEQATDSHPSIRQNPNPNNPQRARSNLRHEFSRQLRENDNGLEDLRDLIGSIRTGIQYAEMLNQVPEDVELRPEEIREQLVTVEDHLEAIDQAVQAMDIKDNIQLPEQDERSETFPETEKALILEIEDEPVGIGERVNTQREHLNELQEMVTQWRQTTITPPDELQHIMEKLDYRQPKDLESVLIALADQAGSDPDLGEFFDQLQELFEGNHIEISVKSEHR